MLQSLYIKNFALIDEISIDFEAGLNIILGETGAGKSIIIDALMTTLGERTSPELVKSGTNKAIVEAIFTIDNPELFKLFLDEFEEETKDTLILRREISSKGQSRCFVNDSPMPLNKVREIGTYLVDFHGQHSHQQLLSPKFQLNLIDSLSDTKTLLEIYSKLKRELEVQIEEIQNLKDDFKKYSQDKEIFEYELNEIIRINPQPNELQRIENELKKLENFELLINGLEEIYEKLYKSKTSVIDILSSISKKLNTLARYDETLLTYLNQIEGIIETLSEISKDISKRNEEINFEPEYIENLRRRISDLKYLEKKYISYENIFIEKEKLEKIIQSTNNTEKLIQDKEKEIIKLKEEISKVAQELHQKRQKGIAILVNKIPEILNELGMKNIIFEVQTYQEISPSNNIEDLCTEINNQFFRLLSNGIDSVEFLIATNPNTKPMPLENIASGGELSRIMLALKSISAEKHKFPTMIFDEIDVGISGKIASKTAQLMKKLASNHQVIAITHLPQIASAGQNTILVEKLSGENTIIRASRLNQEQKIVEIARLLSGEKVTESALENARKLIEETNKLE